MKDKGGFILILLVFFTIVITLLDTDTTVLEVTRTDNDTFTVKLTGEKHNNLTGEQLDSILIELATNKID